MNAHYTEARAWAGAGAGSGVTEINILIDIIESLIEVVDLDQLVMIGVGVREVGVVRAEDGIGARAGKEIPDR